MCRHVHGTWLAHEASAVRRLFALGNHAGAGRHVAATPACVTCRGLGVMSSRRHFGRLSNLGCRRIKAAPLDATLPVAVVAIGALLEHLCDIPLLLVAVPCSVGIGSYVFRTTTIAGRYPFRPQASLQRSRSFWNHLLPPSAKRISVGCEIRSKRTVWRTIWREPA